MTVSSSNSRLNRISPLLLSFCGILLLSSIMLLPRVHESRSLLLSVAAAVGVLAILWLVLWQVARRTGRSLFYERGLRPVHYVQLMMHSSVYIYWGMYWPNVYAHVPLLFAQALFAYVLDMMVCWLRRDKWILGFGMIPIILSTNLFLWFKDDWFYLQFLLVAIGVLGKEFLRWKRDGHSSHIFNPSSFPLFIFSIVLIATHTTGMTWGSEIATTMYYPPHIYFEFFILGLIVQSLFGVTLVTLSAAATLWGLNLLYTAATGTYFFIDSGIPPAIFLSLHLLVTDPATSPRKGFGKVVFGSLYGAAVFALYPVLTWIGAPEFYDKLLCVPLLNLSVRALDRWSESVMAKLPSMWPAWSPRKYNFAHMAIWIFVFIAMIQTGFLTKGADHPGNSAFWQQACSENRYHACQTWVRVLKVTCDGGSDSDCATLGSVFEKGEKVPRDLASAGASYVRACERGDCHLLADFIKAEGGSYYKKSCDEGNGTSCFVLGSAYSIGRGEPLDHAMSFQLFQKSCDAGLSRGCGRLGISYMTGEGTSISTQKALESYEKGCSGQNGPSCLEVAKLYHNHEGGLKDDALVERRLKQACDYGVEAACTLRRSNGRN